MLELLATTGVVFVAALIRGASGFGFALIAAPALSLFHAPEVSTPLTLLLDAGLGLTLLRGRTFTQMRWGEAIAIGGLGLVGSVIGTLLVSEAGSGMIDLGLNLAVLMSALAVLLNLRARWLDHPAIGAGVSFLTGGLVGAFAVGGPLMLAWLLAVHRSPAEIRGTLTLMFAASDVTGIAVRLWLGTFPLESLQLSGILAPAVFLGVYAGSHVFHRIDPQSWRRWVAVLLALIALAGLGRAIMALT